MALVSLIQIESRHSMKTSLGYKLIIGVLLGLFCRSFAPIFAQDDTWEVWLYRTDGQNALLRVQADGTSEEITLPISEEENVYNMTFSGDGALIGFCTANVDVSDQKFYVYDLATLTEIVQVGLGRGTICGAGAFNEDGTLATYSVKNLFPERDSERPLWTVGVIDLGSGTTVATLDSTMTTADPMPDDPEGEFANGYFIDPHLLVENTLYLEMIPYGISDSGVGLAVWHLAENTTEYQGEFGKPGLSARVYAPDTGEIFWLDVDSTLTRPAPSTPAQIPYNVVKYWNGTDSSVIYHSPDRVLNYLALLEEGLFIAQDGQSIVLDREGNASALSVAVNYTYFSQVHAVPGGVLIMDADVSGGTGQRLTFVDSVGTTQPVWSTPDITATWLYGWSTPR
jgi:hypothetical protein